MIKICLSDSLHVEEFLQENLLILTEALIFSEPNGEHLSEMAHKTLLKRFRILPRLLNLRKVQLDYVPHFESPFIFLKYVATI